jgi:hypothetical protein
MMNASTNINDTNTNTNTNTNNNANSSNNNANTANPIKNDPILKKLLAQTQNLKNEEAFSGWRETFMKEYARFLDKAGVHNAHLAEAQLIKYLKELSKAVFSVNDHVQKGTVSKTKVSVMGQRSLTNMTDQMANSKWWLCGCCVVVCMLCVCMYVCCVLASINNQYTNTLYYITITITITL